MISFRYCTQLYANVKVLQVRLQHSPDLEVNAKIVSLLPFQLLLYMIVFKYCSLCYLMLIFCSSRKYPYPPFHGGHFCWRPPPRQNFHSIGCLSYPQPPGISVIIQLGWVPSVKNICFKNVVALYYYAEDNLFLR